MEEKPREDLFEASETKIDDVVPLVNEPYTYENIVNNPVIKPIAECDKSLRDLEEIEYKVAIDIKKLKEHINSVITSVRAYQTSPLIADMIQLINGMGTMNKFQDLKIRNLKKCISHVKEEIDKRYWLKDEQGDKYVEPESIIPEGTVSQYLDKLSQNNDETICKMAIEIKEIFIRTVRGKDEKEKFLNACVEYYGKQTDKNNKKIVGQIARMEI